MAWIIDKIENKCYAAKYGDDLESTERYDPYRFSCLIEDCGNGVALIGNAGGGMKIADRAGLEEKLIGLGFTEVRWVRVVRRKLKTGKGE